MPLRENTKATSGNVLTMFSLANCMSCDCASEVEGMRLTSITMFFSSRMGTNSWPRRVNSRAAATTSSTAAPMNGLGVSTARVSAGR